MTWEQFLYFAIAAVLLWTVGAWAAWREKTALAYTSTFIGLAVFFSFILMMWISLERPPLRTMGETRLWYSFFLPLARQPLQARDPFQDADAGPTESVVRPTCNCLYVRIRRIRCFNCDGFVLAIL